ncbi:tryptophan-rich sensory protein [Aerococcaceae bacterium DSM 111021]|nr:tryptophan-rich sensory protein [Aerococcaceae bacterium DSM 111021]
MLAKKAFQVLFPVIGGSIIGKLTTSNAKKDYKKFKQAPYSPPKEAFGIVWPLLYTTMGIAYSIVSECKDNKESKYAYYIQLGLNYLWSLLYFKFKLRGTALIESYVLLAAVIVTTVSFYKHNKLAGILLIPYVIWSAFASYLNAGNWILNRNNRKYSNE